MGSSNLGLRLANWKNKAWGHFWKYELFYNNLCKSVFKALNYKANLV